MHRDIISVLLIALGISSASVHASENSVWNVRTLRVEGAGAGVRRSAERIQETAKNISDSGVLHGLAPLRSQLDDLHRLVISARLSVDVATEELQTSGGIKASH